MWGTIRTAPRKYLFSSSSTRPSRRESDNQSTLAPVYPEVLSPQKAASTALAIPTQKPIFTHQELLQGIKEKISEFNLPPDPAGKNKENHPLFRAQYNPRIPTLFYLSEDNKIDDAATGDLVLSQLTMGLSDSYNEYISNRRSGYEVGYPDEVNVTREQKGDLDAVRSLQLERPPIRDPPMPTVLETKTNITAQTPPNSSQTTSRDSSPSYRVVQEHQGMGSVDPPAGTSQKALYLKVQAQISSMRKNELLSITSSAKTKLPRHHSSQASNCGLPNSSLQALAHPQALRYPPGPVQTPQENPDQAPHPGRRLTFVPSVEGEEPLMTMGQKLVLGRERVVAMCGFPNPRPMPNWLPPHLNTPSPSTNPPLPSPRIPPPARILQTSDTPPTFKVLRKPLPPSALPHLSGRTSTLEAIQSLTEKDFKSPEQIGKYKPLPPLPRSESGLSMVSIRSSISGRSV